MILIGLIGAAGAGKSTAATCMYRYNGFNIESMSEPIKEMMEGLGVDKSNLYGTQKQKNKRLDILCGKSSREAMQTLGTEWGRKLIGADIWVNCMRSRLARYDGSDDRVVIDDIRFQNEMSMVRYLGGYLARVINPRCTSDYDHESERHWRDADVDFEIINNGGKNDLREKVSDLVVSVLHEEVTRSVIKQLHIPLIIDVDYPHTALS